MGRRKIHANASPRLGRDTDAHQFGGKISNRHAGLVDDHGTGSRFLRDHFYQPARRVQSIQATIADCHLHRRAANPSAHVDADGTQFAHVDNHADLYRNRNARRAAATNTCSFHRN